MGKRSETKKNVEEKCVKRCRQANFRTGFTFFSRTNFSTFGANKTHLKKKQIKSVAIDKKLTFQSIRNSMALFKETRHIFALSIANFVIRAYAKKDAIGDTASVF